MGNTFAIACSPTLIPNFFSGKPTKDPSDTDYIPTVFESHTVTVHYEEPIVTPRVEGYKLMREQEHTRGITEDLDTKQQSAIFGIGEEHGTEATAVNIADSFTVEIRLAKELKTELPTHSFGNKYIVLHCLIRSRCF